ncbi:cytochrome P450 [Emericellopsis atlantica]|uniref:Cytochrome P450 n=1 Tax=Emericellopsis atlantica TaxID=2614577 RepID=A0A9P7ZCB8_9HYPO|nr:cytochrome P450 [Emericellopsis atlantica]KAG9249563.1 cytochrome P450 [Emericellopsis atlantica]
MPSILLGLAGLVAVWLLYALTSWRRHWQRAKASGIQCYLSPCSPQWIPWKITHRIWIPLIKLLPQSSWEAWLPPLTADFSWKWRYDHFDKYGDTFVLVHPFGLHMFTAEASAISAITTRRDHFPKHTALYGILSQFGDNVVTSEGLLWRRHRRATAASFSERNIALAFAESIRQSLGLIRFWEITNGPGATLRTVERDTMRLALNIIGYVGFGLRLPWPQETMPEDNAMSAKYGSVEPPEGYKMSFVTAIETLLENALTLLLVPSWLLRLIPYEGVREAVRSRQQYEQFINELMEAKIVDTSKGERTDGGMDIMGQLVRSFCHVDSTSSPPREAEPGTVRTREEIRGNAFVMIVAGHETTANAIHFTLIHMASCAASQRRLHRELDELLRDKKVEDLDYEGYFQPLMGSMVGACMNETLRVLPPVIEIPKVATPDRDQPLVVDGEVCSVPAGTAITLSAAGVHMNPKHWPTEPSRLRPSQHDLLDYVPERWLRTSDEKLDALAGQPEGHGSCKGREAGPWLFQPERGAYIPFSVGARACLGRRIAQAEVVAALTVLFREYSVELAVDEWATDEEVERMDRQQRRDLYQRAVDKRDATIRKASSLLTLKLRGDGVALRFVKRGEERFVDWLGLPDSP